jgi:hypothetical protein
MHTFVRVLVVGCALASLAMPASAQTLLGPTPYTSQANSPFAALISGGTVVLETFEDGLLNVPNVTASAGAPFGPSGITDSVDADDGTIDGSGIAGNSFFSGSGATGITFTFNPAAPNGLPTHVGIVWTDGDGTTTFEAFGPGGVSLGVIGPVALADGSFTGGTAEDRFFGVINPAGVSSIRISNTLGGIEVDHLQFGRAAATPPAPATTANIPLLGPIGIVLLAAMLAVAGIVGSRRR